MASLQSPLTIISQVSGGNTSSHQKNQPFQPPAATWFDEDPLHFVALEARPRSGHLTNTADSASFRESIVSGVGSIDSSLLFSSSGAFGVGGTTSTKDNSQGGQDDGSGGDNKEDQYEIVQYQAFSLPKNGRRDNDDNDKEDYGSSVLSNSMSSRGQQQHMSAFDAAKKAAQDNLKALTVEISVEFVLPLELATVESASMEPSILSEDDDTFATGLSTVAPSRRIPIMAKFSPKMKNGMRFLAMQYTPTMVRFAIVEGENSSGIGNGRPKMTRRHSISGNVGASGTANIDGAGSNNLHWTIDLSYDAYPISSKPERLPNFTEGSARNIFGKTPKLEEGIVSGSTSIIGGGVLWIARAQSHQEDKNTSLDLIIVTTTSVLVYNMNMVKRQLVKTQIFPHDMAASFWYEPFSRTLVIGSYKNNLAHNSNVGDSGEVHNTSRTSFSVDDLQEDVGGESNKGTLFPSAVMLMKTLFFSKDSPLVETLPTFAVGTLREVTVNEDERHELQMSLETFDSGRLSKIKQEEDAESAVVLPTEIFVVNLYGSAYCIELGSLGMGQGGIGWTKLDSEASCIHVRHQKFEALKGHKVDVESTISVGVIDNLLCIFSKKEETAHFLDVAASFSDDQRVFRESIEVFGPAEDASGTRYIHDERLSFLAPSYFLDTNGQGLLYEVVLDLPLVLEHVPPDAYIIPFIQRRNVPKTTIRTHIMERFSALIEQRDMTPLRKWIAMIVEQYSDTDVALKFDLESTTALLSQSSLLSLDDIVEADDMALMGNVMVPASCSQVLTQTEILQMILLPHAILAIKKENRNKLKFISSLAVHYFVELERRFVAPCVALQCLVLALLWRTGENAELSSFLSAQQSQWTITRRRRQMNLPSVNRMYFDNPGATAFAEALFRIATEDVVDKASTHCAPSTTRQLISYATIILLGCGATSLAVKCLLSAGQLNDAINVCSKKLRGNKSAEDKTLAEGTQSKYFFRAAVSNARKLPTVADRNKSFYHLYCFLQQWDPSAFTLDSRKTRILRRGSSVKSVGQRRRNSFLAQDDLDTMVIEQSVLAHECPRFPDELFGGKESASCKKLRSMFGYFA